MFIKKYKYKIKYIIGLNGFFKSFKEEAIVKVLIKKIITKV